MAAAPLTLPAGRIEIESSAMPVLIGALAGALMFGLSAIVAFRDSPDGPKSNFVLFAGYAGMVVAALASARHFWRASRSQGPILILSETGLRDTRLAAQEIPWAGIYSLATWDFQRQKSLVLSVDPDIEAGLSLTRMARLSRIVNKRYGAQGLCVGVAGLRIDHESLAMLCADRIARAHAGEIPSIANPAP